MNYVIAYGLMKTAKDTSYLRDFMAGVEPTGTYTFEASRRNKERHGKHKAIGIAGGFVGGAAILPGLISGLAMGVPRYLGAGKGRSVKMITDAATKPYKMLYHGFKAKGELKNITSGKSDSTKHIEKVIKASPVDDITSPIAGKYNVIKDKTVGKAVEDSNIMARVNANTMSKADDIADKTVGMVVAEGGDKARKQFIDKLRTDPEFANKIKSNMKRGLYGGVGAIGLSGVTNAMSSWAQYNSGMKTQKPIE